MVRSVGSDYVHRSHFTYVNLDASKPKEYVSLEAIEALKGLLPKDKKMVELVGMEYDVSEMTGILDRFRAESWSPYNHEKLDTENYERLKADIEKLVNRYDERSSSPGMKEFRAKWA